MIRHFTNRGRLQTTDYEPDGFGIWPAGVLPCNVGVTVEMRGIAITCYWMVRDGLGGLRLWYPKAQSYVEST